MPKRATRRGPARTKRAGTVTPQRKAAIPKTDTRAAARADQRRKAAAIASRTDSAALREIGPIPKPVDPARRARAEKSLPAFAVEYFPNRFKRAFGKPHLKLIASLQQIIDGGGLNAVALPRGYGKTTIVDVATLWAVLTGRRRYVAEIAATGPLARKRIVAIKRELQSNPRLLEDWPEVCFPIHKMQGIAQRCKGQTHGGEPTEMVWSASQIVLPTIEGSKASGAVIECGGLLSAVRGLQYVTTAGEILRPDLAILDDPQTRRSARSRGQTEAREELITGDLLYLAGHDSQIACVCCITVIYPDDLADRLTDRKRNPEWQGQREKMLLKFPKHMDLWDRYAELRKQGLVDTGKADAANEYYRAKRKKMDVGGRVTWDGLGTKDELSALQHAMNLYYRNPDAFACEAQNQPVEAGTDESTMTVRLVIAKQSELDPLIAPADTLTVTAFADVHKGLLYYAVAAYSAYLTGRLLHYGTWPKQRTAYFTLETARHRIPDALPELGTIQARTLAALGRLGELLESLAIVRPNGKRVPLDLWMIDANYMTDEVFQFAPTSPIPCMPSHGRYYGPRHKPIQYGKPEPGELMGPNWRIPTIRPHRQCRAVTWDTNRWKSDFRRALAAPAGTSGGWYLHKAPEQDHKLLAEHLLSEFATSTSGPYGELEEWTLKPNEDNHFLDCCVGTLVAASVRGVSRGGAVVQQGAGRRARRRRSVSF